MWETFGQVLEVYETGLFIRIVGLDLHPHWIPFLPEIPDWALEGDVFEAELSNEVVTVEDLVRNPHAIRNFKPSRYAGITDKEVKELLELPNPESTMPKTIDSYLTCPAPPELLELQKNAHTFFRYRPLCLLLCEFVSASARLNFAEEKTEGEEVDEPYTLLADDIAKDDLLRPILRVRMPCQHWVELLGWCQELTLLSLESHKQFTQTLEYQEISFSKAEPPKTPPRRSLKAELMLIKRTLLTTWGCTQCRKVPSYMVLLCDFEGSRYRIRPDLESGWWWACENFMDEAGEEWATGKDNPSVQKLNKILVDLGVEHRVLPTPNPV